MHEMLHEAIIIITAAQRYMPKGTNALDNWAYDAADFVDRAKRMERLNVPTNLDVARGNGPHA